MSKLSKSIQLKMLAPIFYLILAYSYFAYTAINQNLYTNHVMGAAVTILAFVLWIISRIQLGNSFTLAPEAKHLVKTGIYSKLRHPVYYFSILAVTGIVIFSWSIYALLALALLITVEIVRIRQEEDILEKKFGHDYVEYKRSTWF